MINNGIKQIPRAKPGGISQAWTFVAEKKAAWFFIAPPLAILAVLIIYPTFHLWSMALSRYDIAFMEGPEFIGLRNFVRMTTDIHFHNAIKNTFILSMGAVVLEFIIGLGLALLLYEPLRGSFLVKPVIIIPMMIPPVVVGMNFRLILDTFGPMNGLLNLLKLPAIDWLGTPTMARLSIILADVWQWSPFIFIIMLAALNAIPAQLIDAARVDGASSRDLFRYVLWPMIVPSIAVALTFRFIDALKLFDTVYILTYGGPADATVVVSLYVYRTAFRFGQFGYAAALGVALLLFSSLVVMVVLKILRLERRLGWEES
jgi:multiple sugar transport system permease protein